MMGKSPPIFHRWCIVFIHDSSPIDFGLFVHKSAAQKALAQLKNKSKLRVARFDLKENII
jgi:hypothetical protein